MKDPVMLHYGKCRIMYFWILTHTRDEKLGYSSLCCFVLTILFLSVSFDDDDDDDNNNNNNNNLLSYIAQFMHKMEKVELKQQDKTR